MDCPHPSVRQISDPTILGAFQRWQDPAWKRETLSLRQRALAF